MNRLITSLIPSIAVAVFISISACAFAHNDGASVEKKAKRTPDAVKPIRVERKRSKICMSPLEVDSAGAHLLVGHVVVMLGPVPGQGSYLVFAEPSEDPEVKPLRWGTPVLHAIKTDMPHPDGTVYMLKKVPVSDPDKHPEWEDHTMLLIIKREEDGCPREIDIVGESHPDITGFFHGGIAHADN